MLLQFSYLGFGRDRLPTFFPDTTAAFDPLKRSWLQVSWVTAVLTWLRYVDDVLVVVPADVKVDEKLRVLNTVDQKMQFTVENENEGKI